MLSAPTTYRGQSFVFAPERSTVVSLTIRRLLGEARRPSMIEFTGVATMADGRRLDRGRYLWVPKTYATRRYS
jgi:hypothetical protein